MGNCCGTKTLEKCCVAACSNYMVVVNMYHCMRVTLLYATGTAKVKAAKSLVLSAGIVFLAVLS